MKFSLHAYSLSLHMGLHTYKPIGQGIMQIEEFFKKAKAMGFSNLQLVEKNLPPTLPPTLLPNLPADSPNQPEGLLDLMALARLGNDAKRNGLTLHFSSDKLSGDALAKMIHAASTAGAKSVTVEISNLEGHVKERTERLQGIIHDLEPALKAAETWKIMLLIKNGLHIAAVDLLAFIKALNCEYVGICFDTGNPLSVPEDPYESARTLKSFIRAIHMKDFEVYRTTDGIKLVNCPLGTSKVINFAAILELIADVDNKIPKFILTDAERIEVPLLQDAFLDAYPRITAKALVTSLRKGKTTAEEEFPFEIKNSDKVILDFEEKRLRESLKEMNTLMGEETGTLDFKAEPE